MASALRRRKRRGKVNRDPLRKIIGYKEVDVSHNQNGMYLRHEELECGHTVLPRQDIIGETNAYRRRCWQCGRDEAAAE